MRTLAGMPWERWVTHPRVEEGIDGQILAFGLLYAASALAVMLPGLRGRAGLIAAGGAGLFLLSLLFAKEKFWRIGELMEYASQWMAPALLLLHAAHRSPRLVARLGRAAVAATFAGHGLYAVGFHPVPGPFIDMVIQHLGVTEDTARALLLAMGLFDFAVAAAMLLPSRLARPFLAYAAAWGALTTLARLAAGFDATMAGFGAIRWVPEILVRVPHALVPLFLLALSRETGAPGGAAVSSGGRPDGHPAAPARP